MDDIMVLMSKMVIDLQSFDETQIGLFDTVEQEDLLKVWQETRDVNKFIRILSPAQKYKMAVWATSRTSLNVAELTKTLEKFVKFLKSSSYAKHQLYPKRKSH